MQWTNRLRKASPRISRRIRNYDRYPNMRLVPDFPIYGRVHDTYNVRFTSLRRQRHLWIWHLFQQYANLPVLYLWHEIDSVMKLTSLTSTSLCPLAACWLSLSWLCSFTTSWAAFRRWSSATSSSASNRFTLCSNSRDRSSGMPPSESFNDRTLVFNSRFSSWSLATYQERNWSYFPTNHFGEMNTSVITSDLWEAIKKQVNPRIKEIYIYFVFWREMKSNQNTPVTQWWIQTLTRRDGGRFWSTCPAGFSIFCHFFFLAKIREGPPPPRPLPSVDPQHGGKTKRAKWAWYRTCSNIRSITWYGKISGL